MPDLSQAFSMSSNLEDPRKNSRAKNANKHGRSLSHPFPSLFGKQSDKKGTPRTKNKVDSSDDDLSDAKEVSQDRLAPIRSHSTPTHTESMTGKCMTCGSTVRWPRDLVVFRCTTCLTINDLEPCQRNDPSAAQAHDAGGVAASQSPRRGERHNFELNLVACG